MNAVRPAPYGVVRQPTPRRVLRNRDQPISGSVRAPHTVANDKQDKLIYIAAWNQWTQDHVLLSDTYWRYSYLEALRRAAKD